MVLCIHILQYIWFNLRNGFDICARLKRKIQQDELTIKFEILLVRQKGVMVGQSGKNPLRSLNCGFDIAFRELSFKRKRQMFLEKLFSFIRSFYAFSYPTITSILTLFPYPQYRMKSDILLLKSKAQRFISLEWGKAVTCNWSHKSSWQDHGLLLAIIPTIKGFSF